MATRTWSGAGDGVTFTSGSNWNGGTPSNDDTLVVNSTSAAIAGAGYRSHGDHFEDRVRVHRNDRIFVVVSRPRRTGVFIRFRRSRRVLDRELDQLPDHRRKTEFDSPQLQG